MVKNLPGNAGDIGSNPGLGRSPEEEMAYHSSILAWESPWMEEPDGLLSLRSQRAKHNGAPMHLNSIYYIYYI